jgi:aspartyl-tRNA(Asn)/glutamyl-tRNA(Gln) amidotransferase subunit A
MASDPRTIAELGRAIRAGETSAEATTQRCLATIRERDAGINAFIHVAADEALAQARQADRERGSGHDRGPLHGVPISLKDLIDVRGMATTAASHVRRGHVATADAELTRRLREAGAVLIGKTNLHEFAFGTTNEDSAYGPVHHPLDATRSSGGSSGGSAASVLAGMAYASIGTDTGGSIRIPSAVCGLVGLKPSIGEVPTSGVVPLSRTLDHIGPLCRTVEDTAIVYRVLRGAPHALQSSPEPPHTTVPGLATARGLRLGVLGGYFLERLDPEVADAFSRACARLTESGAVLDDVRIPHAAEISPVYVHITLAEAAAVHARTLESHGADYTPNVRLRLEMGRYVLAEDYVRARVGQEVLTREVEAALSGRDALFLPTIGMPAVRLGATMVNVGGVEEPVRNIAMRLTQLFNISGHPALSLPCGTTATGLPIGVQLAGRAGNTPALLDVAATVEAALSREP